MNIPEAVEKIIVNDVASSMNLNSLSHDDNLLEQSIIDSLGLRKLIDYIEKKFKIEIPDDDIVPDNFETINSMAKLIESHMIK